MHRTCIFKTYTKFIRIEDNVLEVTKVLILLLRTTRLWQKKYNKKYKYLRHMYV